MTLQRNLRGGHAYCGFDSRRRTGHLSFRDRPFAAEVAPLGHGNEREIPVHLNQFSLPA